MAVLLVLFTFLLCFLIYIYYKNVYRFYKSIEDFPCPPALPILGNTCDFISGKELLDVLMDYRKEYGDIVRLKIGPTRQILLVSDYKLFELILINMKVTKKTPDYKYFHRWLGTGLVTSEGAKWKKHRQIITPTFHFKILEDFVNIFESNGKILIEQFEKHLGEDSINVHSFLNLCTLDIICEAAMGTSVNAQENMRSEYVQSVKTILDVLAARIFSPKMFDFVYYFTKDYQTEKKCLEVIHSYTKSVIRKRQVVNVEEKKKKKAFLDLLLEANIDGQLLTLEEIREEVDTFMFAGHDTTASAISFALFCLANHPEEQSKVFQEQKQIFEDGFNQTVTLQHLKEMKYLELVIKEVLRLYPSGPFFSRELDQDVVFEGKTLPKGLTVTLSIYGIHRNPMYFPEPEKFCPSRFESIDGKTPFVPFGAGPRNCIGQKFAMLEMLSVISRVVRTFEILPSNPLHELQIASHVVLTSKNGICVRFKKRTQCN